MKLSYAIPQSYINYPAFGKTTFSERRMRGTRDFKETSIISGFFFNIIPKVYKPSACRCREHKCSPPFQRGGPRQPML